MTRSRLGLASMVLALVLMGMWVSMLQACTPVGVAQGRAMPVLRLQPAQLGRSLSARQHIEVHAPGLPVQTAEVLLEVDAQQLQLALIALGQTAARLRWDGQTLSESRAVWAPSGLSAERILTELQLTLWPTEAIRQALPSPWTLDEVAGVRTLFNQGQQTLVVTQVAAGQWMLEHLSQHYQLRITTLSQETQP